MEKEIQRTLIYDGKIMQVTREEVELENGEHAYREVVYHHGGVCILAVKDHQIILVKQFRYPNRIQTIEVPAGKLEKDEDPQDCAFRELEEETNNRARDMKFIMKVLPSPGYTSEWLYLYEAIDFEEVNDALAGDDDEFIDIIKLDIDEAYQKLQAELSNLNSDLAVVKNKLENITTKKSELEEQLENTNSRLKDIEEKIKALSLSQNGQSESEIEEQVAKLNKQKKQMQEALAEINKDLGKFDAQINNLDQVATRNYNLRKNTAAEQEEYSARLGELKSQINQKLGILSEEYSLTFEAALQLSEGQNTTDLRKKLEREVHLHKMSLADIGEVNLNSIEEYEDVKTRYDFLNGQQNDLLKARKDIEESMSKLDDEVKSRFSATFHQIERSFAKIFPIMFDGGHARLELTDPKNLLETGIEIIAQPPGKKSQKLTLLSGGERALTAITLLFAMLQVNPVPFCILDEVEAALDETNVDRFAQFLNHYDMKTQFIVITHRRGTMQKADNLYGIVMQESGISKVLSVSLNEIKKEVN